MGARGGKKKQKPAGANYGRPRRPPPPRPVIVLIDSDTHFGSVLSPVVKFTKANGQDELPTLRQTAGAEAWAERTRFFRKLKEDMDAALVYVHLGDVTEGVKHKSRQRFSEEVEDHVRLAQIMLADPVSIADQVVAIRGTEAHAGVGSSLEEAAFHPYRLKVWRPAGAVDLTQYRALVNIGGVRFDFEHHVAGAARPWTYGGNIQRRAVSAIYEMARQKAATADYVFRGHLHIGHDTGDNPPGPRGIICRPWKWEGDAFSHRIASEFMPTVGCQYVVIRTPEDHSFKWWTAPLPVPQVWHELDAVKRPKVKK